MFTRVTKAAPFSMAASLGLWQYQKRKNENLTSASCEWNVYHPFAGIVTYPFFKSAVHNNPKFDKRHKGGEDSALITSNRRLLGVADGVGGWGEVEVCSGKCSKFLCQKIAELYKADYTRGLKSIFLDGVKALAEEKVEGSTTVVLTRLERFSGSRDSEELTMKTMMLGDSTYMILRPESD